ncbi:MAG: transglycosylase domain-containing protein [Microthrixaceae bacterium]
MPRPLSLLLRFTLITIAGVCAFGLVVSQLVPQVAKLSDAASFDVAAQIALPELQEGSTILDMNGDVMGELVGAENRIVVPLEAISTEMREAVLAVEDSDFYRHHGVSARSILRAVQANSEAGTISQGGSTITQQLVKLSLVGDETSLRRKVKEASLAIQLENQYCENTTQKECKDHILEQYLNTVYLGRGAYGVEAAAQLYFGVSASELSWGQAAILTSLIRNPNNYDPIRYPEVAERRREVVLGRMVEVGAITQAESDFIAASPLPTEVHTSVSSASAQDLDYFERKVRDELLKAEWLAPTEELRRYLIFNGGLTITSTFDPRAQYLAQLASDSNPIQAANPETVAVVASVEPATGAVRAVVGETNIPGKGLVEIATPALGRSPGSSFKTFTLLAALEAGYTIRDSILASPAPQKLYRGWGITDSTWPSGCRGGTIDLARATSSSNNCAFVRLQAAVGGDKVVGVARRLGINTMRDTAAMTPSLTLGGTEVRPLEMAAAYAAIANDGKFNPPHFVSKVSDRDGNVLFEYEPSTEQAIPVEVARQATEALEGVVSGGTYKGGSLPNRQPAAGKTGTNEATDGGNTDVWFVGFTPQMSTAVWIGNPAAATNMKGGRVQGGTVAGRVWHEFMAPYLDGSPVVEFTAPRRITSSRKVIPDPWKSSMTSADRARSGGSTTTRPPGSTTTAPSSPTTQPDAGPSDDADGNGGGGGGGAGNGPGGGNSGGGNAGGGGGGGPDGGGGGDGGGPAADGG